MSGDSLCATCSFSKASNIFNKASYIFNGMYSSCVTQRANFRIRFNTGESLPFRYPTAKRDQRNIKEAQHRSGT